jgi:hypothetical protein
MGVVVPVAWVRLAVLAEVGVMAHGALVANTLNVRGVLTVAKGTIAVDAVVAVTAIERLGERIIDGHEAVARMNVLGALDTIRAVVPIWAVEALVADTVDELIAAIANGGVANVSPRVAEEVG